MTQDNPWRKDIRTNKQPDLKAIQEMFTGKLGGRGKESESI